MQAILSQRRGVLLIIHMVMDFGDAHHIYCSLLLMRCQFTHPSQLLSDVLMEFSALVLHKIDGLRLMKHYPLMGTGRLYRLDCNRGHLPRFVILLVAVIRALRAYNLIGYLRVGL